MKLIAVLAAAVLPRRMALQRRDELGLNRERLWRALQNDLATATPTPGTVVLAARSSHRVAEQQPALVAAQIEQVVAKART